MAEKKYLDHEGLVEFWTKLKEYIGDAGHIVFQGQVNAVANLPAVADQKVGYMYAIKQAGTTTADFLDGEGKAVAENSEVAAVKLVSTSENSVWSINGGTSYVDEDVASYTPTGTLGSATVLAEGYVADGTETSLVSGTLYATDNTGTTYYEVTKLADTFANFTKTQVTDSDKLVELGTIYGAGSFKNVNLYTETVTTNSMKWCLLGPIFDVSDRLQYGSSMPAEPANGDTFLYMGDTTYEYDEVTPEGTENPKELGWYVKDGDTYELTADETVDSGTTYYVKNEEYVTGVIYVYDETSATWVQQTAGDTMVAITKAEIDALFEE